jgi:hypothetical protein
MHGCNWILHVGSHPFFFAGQSDQWSFHDISDSPNRNFVFASVTALQQSAIDNSKVATFSRTVRLTSNFPAEPHVPSMSEVRGEAI